MFVIEGRFAVISDYSLTPFERVSLAIENRKTLVAIGPSKWDAARPIAYPAPRSTHAPCSGALTDLGFSLQKSTAIARAIRR